MKLKWMTWVVVLGISLPLFTSCLGTNSTTLSENAKFTSFIINNDSVEGLSNVKLTINNTDSLIYNVDSLAYGTRVDSVYATITGSSLGSIVINDSIIYTDSLVFNFNEPVMVRSYAADMLHYINYTVKVNVHQVNPDLFVWEGVTTQVYSANSSADHAVYFNETIYYFVKEDSQIALYTSSNGSSWNNETCNLPTTANVYGIVIYGNSLAAVADGVLYTSTDGKSWSSVTTTGTVEQLLFTLNGTLYALSSTTTSPDIIALQSDNSWKTILVAPDEFPVSGSAICVAPSPTGVNRAYLVGGVDINGNALQTVWSTENGNYYANLGGGNNPISARTQAAVVQYAEGLMLFGGRNGNNLIDNVLLYSPDYGINWFEPTEEMAIGDLYAPRYGLSAVISDDNRILLVGGRNESMPLRDVWKGYQYAELPGFNK